MKKGQTVIHSHEQAFMNGSIEKGLSGLNPNMGFNLWDDLLKPVINKETAPEVVALPTSQLPPITKPNMTMTYVKYGAFAIGGVVLLAMAMKMMKGRKAA